MTQRSKQPPAARELTAAEAEEANLLPFPPYVVLTLLAEGFTPLQVARRLQVAPEEFNRHLTNYIARAAQHIPADALAELVTEARARMDVHNVGVVMMSFIEDPEMVKARERAQLPAGSSPPRRRRSGGGKKALAATGVQS